MLLEERVCLSVDVAEEVLFKIRGGDAQHPADLKHQASLTR